MVHLPTQRAEKSGLKLDFEVRKPWTRPPSISSRCLPLPFSQAVIRLGDFRAHGFPPAGRWHLFHGPGREDSRAVRSGGSCGFDPSVAGVGRRCLEDEAFGPQRWISGRYSSFATVLYNALSVRLFCGCNGGVFEARKSSNSWISQFFHFLVLQVLSISSASLD